MSKMNFGYIHPPSYSLPLLWGSLMPTLYFHVLFLNNLLSPVSAAFIIWVGAHTLKHNQPIRDYTHEENQISLPQQPATAHSSSARAEALSTLPNPRRNADWLDLVQVLFWKSQLL